MTDARWPGWPFPSTDPRVTPQPVEQHHQKPKLCMCDAELTPRELQSGKCDSCGGMVSCWNSIVSNP